MRPPRESLLLLGLMTAVCLLAGLLFGVATGQFVKPPQATPTASPQPQPTHEPSPGVIQSVTPGVQKTLLLLGVTDAYALSASLEACWVITFRSGVPEYYVVAFPPSARLAAPGLEGMRTLSEIHSEDVRLQLDHNFVTRAIETRFSGMTIETALVLDRSDLAALVTQLGGVPLNNQVLTGPALLTTYDNWPVATDLDRLRVQGDILQQIFALLAARQWTAGDLVQFVTQLPRLNADPAATAELAAFAADAPPVAGAALIWRPFGPEMETATMPAGSTP